MKVKLYYYLIINKKNIINLNMWKIINCNNKLKIKNSFLFYVITFNFTRAFKINETISQDIS